MRLDEIVLLYNSIPNPCIIIKPDQPSFTIAALNEAFITSTSLGSEVVGRAFFDVFPPNSNDEAGNSLKINKALNDVVLYKKPVLIRHHRYDLPPFVNAKEAQYWNVEMYPLLNEVAEVQYIIQSATDVSALFNAEKKLNENRLTIAQDTVDRKDIEHELWLSNQRYSYLDKATVDTVYDWDIDKDHIHWGQAFFTSFGYSRQEQFSLEQWFEIIHQEDVEEVKDTLDEVLADPTKNNWTGNYRLKRNDGTFADVEENGYILRYQGRAVRIVGVIRDVTEKKNAQLELQLLSDTYSDLFNLSPLPMLVYSLETLMYLDANEAATTHYGYTKAEFLSMSVADVLPDEDKADLIQIIKNKVKPGPYHTYSAVHKKKSGELIDVNTRSNSIRYGNVEARLVVFIDITDRVRSEKALTDSERRFKTLIQQGSDLISIIGPGGDCTYVSPNTLNLLGVPSDEFVGKNAVHLVHEEDREYLIQQFKLLDDHKQIKLSPFRYIDSLQRVQWVETIVTDMRGDDAIGGIVCNSRLVTDRIESELKIKAHLDRYNAVSKATSDAIWEVDMTTGNLLWNHGIKALFGYEEIGSDYQWWYDHVHPDDVDVVEEQIQRSIAQKNPTWTREYRFLCTDGNYKNVLDRGFVIFDDQTGDPVRMIGAMQDITERAAYTQQMEEHIERLKDIAWTQAHLVRDPLSQILAIISLLMNFEYDENTRKDLLCKVDTAAESLDKTVRQIILKSETALKGISDETSH